MIPGSSVTHNKSWFRNLAFIYERKFLWLETIPIFHKIHDYWKKYRFFFHALLCKKPGWLQFLLGVKFTNHGDLEGKLSSWTKYFFCRGYDGPHENYKTQPCAVVVCQFTISFIEGSSVNWRPVSRSDS